MKAKMTVTYTITFTEKELSILKGIVGANTNHETPEYRFSDYEINLCQRLWNEISRIEAEKFEELKDEFSL